MNDISHQRGFAECFMCAGRGIISDRPCFCGRPLVWYYGAFASCNALSCFEKAKAAEKARLAKIIEKSEGKVLTYPPGAL